MIPITVDHWFLILARVAGPINDQQLMFNKEPLDDDRSCSTGADKPNQRHNEVIEKYE